MDSEFYGLDLHTLQVMYEEEARRLNAGLLAGATWDSMKEQKQKVTELAIVIHKKKYPLYFNPAEFPSSRNEKDDSP